MTARVPAVSIAAGDQRRAFELDGIVAELNPGGRIPAELEARSLEILAREVLPALP